MLKCWQVIKLRNLPRQIHQIMIPSIENLFYLWQLTRLLRFRLYRLLATSGDSFTHSYATRRLWGLEEQLEETWVIAMEKICYVTRVRLHCTLILPR